jgi:hypothetical protein
MRNGIAIAIAWPETKCKQAGAWYDLPMKWLKINRDSYYKVGHAAVVLIDKENSTCHYFDFGRYHAPVDHGRVRNSFTDHDLEMKTIPQFSTDGSLLNFHDILNELYNNPSCHGDGALHASYTSVSFKKSFDKANQLQICSPLPYGPFIVNGTNCSRFVNSVILAGNPPLFHRFQLLFPKTLSPTPIGNVRSLKSYKVVSKQIIYKKNINSSKYIKY